MVEVTDAFVNHGQGNESVAQRVATPTIIYLCCSGQSGLPATWQPVTLWDSIVEALSLRVLIRFLRMHLKTVETKKLFEGSTLRRWAVVLWMKATLLLWHLTTNFDAHVRNYLGHFVSSRAWLYRRRGSWERRRENQSFFPRSKSLYTWFWGVPSWEKTGLHRRS